MIPLDLVTALPELLLACLAMALLMFGAFRGDKATPTVLLLSVVTLVVLIGLIALGPRGEGTAFGGLFVSDGYGDFMKVLVLVGSATAMVMSLRYFE
ncbi:MAG: NADH-quinone oxidoreductase subunit N, partial [Proteobacteria bacterium]|nr:NADH-quinone oxidoreductase subunit N [Pseudomonadota bacterium]